MPSAFTHAFAALALGQMFTAAGMSWRFWLLSALCAVLPDADVIGFAFGVRYSDMLGHRGLTHSLLFALVIALLVVRCAFAEAWRDGRARRALVSYFFLVTASHGVLDALTNGGLGVAFFAPFDHERYFFPWRPIEVSPIGVGSFFGARGLAVITNEVAWVWLPASLLVSLVWVVRRLLQPRR